MFLMLLVFVIGKKKNYFKSLKFRDSPSEESAVTAEEITRLKSLMTDQTGADFKVVNSRILISNLICF